MNNSIFRKKSIDKVTSPEELNDYIRVVSPGVWLVMAAVILLLAGAIVWGGAWGSSMCRMRPGRKKKCTRLLIS